jgi:NADH-quinone oxidoreductase subunit H
MAVTLIPISDNLYVFNPKYGLLYVILIFTALGFVEVFIGIDSQSKYGVIGGVRAYFQMLAAHLPFLLSVICIVSITKTFNIIEIVNFQSGLSLGVVLLPVFVVYFFTSLIILNRTPFDFTEAESEIVAGNYTEYGGMLFAMIYLSEYVNLVFVSALIVLLFMGGWNPVVNIQSVSPYAWMAIKTMIIITFIICIRAIFPRYKQNKIIKFSWLLFCPIVMIYTMLFI